MVADNLMAPIQSILEVMAKVPETFGGGMFKDALAGVKEFRGQVQFEAKKLDKEVITPNLDIDSPLGKLNA
jgi:hypothetical protein